jgi:hypothetical protein
MGHELVNRVMASIQHLGDPIIHGGQDITRTECLQRRDVVRLIELSLSIAVVTHLRPFLYAINRRRGAIPERGDTILLTSSEGHCPTFLS